MKMKEYKVIVGNDGNKYWYLNDNLHREDGPAIEYTNGTNCWYLNDKLHSEDGPAVEYADGNKHWYLRGIEYSEEEFLKRKATTKELTMAELVEILGYNVKIVK